MTADDARRPGGYDTFYESFDSPLMQRLRLEAYGEDIGQHSWVTADELTQDIPRLGLSQNSRLLDLGCGPGGPLAFVVGRIGCRAVGVDVSPAAIDSALARASSLGLSALVDFVVADLNEAIPLPANSFSAVMSVDVVVHLRDREAVFREVARLLEPAGRLMFTDAGVLTGPVSSEDMERRALHGFTQFAPEGFNELTLAHAGFRLLDSINRTPNLLENAKGRLASRLAHRTELLVAEGEGPFEAQRRYLQTVVDLSERGAVSRKMYLAEVRGT